MSRAAVLLAALMIALVAPAAARAGTLVDRAVQGLQSDNVYVDPDASPGLSDADAQRLRDRIASTRAGAVYVAVMPEAIDREAGGDPTSALGQIARGINQHGTYVLVAGRHLRALSDRLEAGEAGQLASDAIDARKADGLPAILLDFVDRVGEAQSSGGGSGGGDGGGGGHHGGGGDGGGGGGHH